jgi:hypothetical protein
VSTDEVVQILRDSAGILTEAADAALENDLVYMLADVIQEMSAARNLNRDDAAKVEHFLADLRSHTVIPLSPASARKIADAIATCADLIEKPD